VDNITHALVGAAMAECAAPRVGSARARAAFLVAGVVSANAPDVDLLYTGIIEEPIGYLLHHRGHSHTVPGLAVLGLVIWSAMRVWPSARVAARSAESRWIVLIAAGLAGHLLMDAANSYGTHLLYPFSSRWFYGDAVFVLEPWLWAIFGVTVTLNARRLWRVVPVMLTLTPIGALVYAGLLPVGMAAVILGVVGTAAIVARAWDRRRRAGAALVASAAIFVGMAGISRIAKAEARQAAALLGGGALVDVVADANPGMPWCWAVLTLQTDFRGVTETLTARRATLSLVPGAWPATSCPSARLSARWTTDAAASRTIVWHRRWDIDVGELRMLADRNCRVGAWLQFGRVPHVADGRIADVRFENPIGQNFTPMALDGGCPSFLTDWQLPRNDVLAPRSDRP
jgi:inner membrane protein